MPARDRPDTVTIVSARREERRGRERGPVVEVRPRPPRSARGAAVPVPGHRPLGGQPLPVVPVVDGEPAAQGQGRHVPGAGGLERGTGRLCVSAGGPGVIHDQDPQSLHRAGGGVATGADSRGGRSVRATRRTPRPRVRHQPGPGTTEPAHQDPCPHPEGPPARSRTTRSRPPAPPGVPPVTEQGQQRRSLAG